jgi:hypothetical protein
MTDCTLYSQLCRTRDNAAYAVVGVAHVALALGNVELLRDALSEFEVACFRVDEFHEANSKKENQSHVRSAASRSDVA